LGSSWGGLANLRDSLIIYSKSMMSKPYLRFKYLAVVFLPLNLPPIKDILIGNWKLASALRGYMGYKWSIISHKYYPRKVFIKGVESKIVGFQSLPLL